MCGVSFPFTWLMIGWVYMLVLIGGTLVLRGTAAPVRAWMLFGMIATFAGVFVFTGTMHAAAGAPEAVGALAAASC